MSADQAIYRAGARVALAADVPGRKALKAGTLATVVVGNDDGLVPWGLVTIVLGDDPEQCQAFQLHPRHLAPRRRGRKRGTP